MAGVKFKDVSKSYDNRTKVVRDVSFEVYDKEFVVLVGPSGCGKSTILRMVAGLESITGGEISIGDRIVNELLPKDRDIAMVFQNYALYPHMTVFQNMAFGLKIQRIRKDEIEKRVKGAAEILEISHLLERKPGAMSGGQRQRVAIGRAIVRKPKVFLFDEPLSNLDAKLRVQMRIELQNLHRKLRSTMIYVTHDQTEAMTLGDRIVVLKDGDIMQIGTPMELYDSPSNLFVAGFIGSPPINIIPGRIKGNSFTDTLGDLVFELPESIQQRLSAYEGHEVKMGLRPENIYEKEQPAIKDICEVPVSITGVEHMGNEIFLYGDTGKNNIIARVTPGGSLVPGQATTLHFDLRKAIFFDTVTERLIG